MHHLDLYDVLAVAARVMDCDSSRVVGHTDLDLVDQVLVEVRCGPGDLADAAAVLLSGLVRHRPFRGPNRLIAVAVTLQFVTLNNADLELEPVEEFDSLLDQISAGEATTPWVAQILRQRLGPEHTAAVIVADFSEEAVSWKEIDMFERFSERARRVMVLAQDEARALNHDYIGTEHVLLGLIQEGDGVGAKALANLGISAPAVRAVIKETIGRGHDQPRGHIPFTPRTKTVLELSHRESTQLGQGYIGTEHILLGLVREGEGVAAQCLTKLGADLDKVRQQVLDLLGYRDRGEALVRRFLTEGGEHSGNQPWATAGRQHHNLLAELVGLLDENERLHDEVARLRQTLRRHDLDPDA
jgi:Clp amino terminal domain, pathogenicity island component